MKKILALTIFGLVVIGGGFVLFLQREAVFSKKNGSEQNQKTENQNQIRQNAAVLVGDKKITDNTKPFKIDITYPYIEGKDDFNKKVSEIIDSELSSFKNNSLENDNAAKQTDPASYAKYPREYLLNIDYTKGQINENAASFMLNVQNYTGGAHGAHYFLPINYSLKNTKEITLSDLFSDQPDYLNKISVYCAQNLKIQIEEKFGTTDGAWIDQGTEPNLENFSVFLINPSTGSGQETITFYFPEYQVASYAAGSFVVEMPL